MRTKIENFFSVMTVLSCIVAFVGFILMCFGAKFGMPDCEFMYGMETCLGLIGIAVFGCAHDGMVMYDKDAEAIHEFSEENN